MHNGADQRAGDEAAQRVDPRPPLWDLKYHLPRLARVVEIGSIAGVHIHNKRGRGADEARRSKLKAVDGQTSLHIQREDPHDPPDPRAFGGPSAD